MNIAETPIPPLSKIALARSYRQGTRLGSHVHREAQLLFASSGVMQVTTPKGRWLVPSQRAVWLPPRMEHAVEVLADIEMRALLIDPAWLSGHPAASPLSREFVVEVRPLLRELVLTVFAEGTHADRGARLARLALDELVEAEDAATFIPIPVDKRARQVAEFILAAPGHDRALADLADAAGSSPRTITRLFPVETGLTFKEWRQRARIMAAVEMLGRGPASIKQVSARLGFSSVAAFGHAFRQVMGMSPSGFVGSSIDAS